MEDGEALGFNVRYQGRTILIPLLSADPKGLLDQVQEKLTSETGVPPELQKLVAKGGRALQQKDENASSILKKLAVPLPVLENNPKLVQLQMIGTSPEILHEFQASAKSAQEQADRMVVNDMDVDYDMVAKERKARAAQREKASRLNEANSSEFRFYDVRALQQFRDSAKAEEILFDLSTDPGFLALMRKHKWKVGCLSEMYPDGKVGVDPVCILGLNVNKGQEIKLRLRTDDLRGFRKIAEIRKVLIHELTHNVWGDHDENFYKFMRQLEREIADPSINWTAGKGRQLGGRPMLFRPQNNNKPTGGGAYILGQEDSMPNKEEQPKGDKEEEEEEDVKKAISTPAPSEEDDNVEKAISTPAPSEEEENVIKAAPSSLLPPPSPEKENEIRIAIGKLVERNSLVNADRGLDFIQKVLSRVLEYPKTKKYRRLRLSSDAFQRNLSQVLGARHVLEMIGWVPSQEDFLYLPDDSIAALGVVQFSAVALCQAKETISPLIE
jgi:hypothetical protein